MNTTLSYRGYYFDKSQLTQEQLENVKNKLTVTPNVPEDYAQNKPKPFKLYQESQTKLYIPKYYGIKQFGLPNVNKLFEGKDIHLTFNGSLRPYQTEAAIKYLEAAKNPSKMGGIVNVYCGWGKCLGFNTPIMMFNGSIKMVQNVKVGDVIMGDNSTPRNVLSICRGQEPLYKISYSSGSYIVNQSHILSLICKHTLKIIDISVSDYINNTDKYSNLMGYRVSISFPEIYVDIDPYTFGTQLCATKTVQHNILNKYICNSRNIRLNVLAGVIDMCGMFVNDFYEIVLDNNQKLVCHIEYIARSLGFITKKISNNTIQVSGDTLHEIPVRVVWKVTHNNLTKSQNYFNNVSEILPITIEPIGFGNYYGFEIDGNKRFVLGDFCVTHNTTLAIHVICALSKKTLIVCHKDFLLQQWKERIEQFTNGAKIGLLKAKTIDVEDKDIVLASLQSLSMKDYDENIFKDFGLFIADEAHHFPAEVFSKALKKVNFKYSLGLTATLIRKDGLTKVLKWYIGDVVYRAKDRKDELQVHLIEYYDPNPSYSLEVKSFNNKLNVSKMINNICDYQPRIDFIIDKLNNVLKKEPDRKVIILSDRRNHLELLQQAITKMGYESAFYVGGMKQNELKQSEQKQIILATYHIAAEGFDCPGLDTLILASPKSDVVQCIGRIQRTPQNLRKHTPLVLDIVDNFSLFARQGKKRYAYYQSCNYFVDNEQLFTSHNKQISLQGNCFIEDS